MQGQPAISREKVEALNRNSKSVPLWALMCAHISAVHIACLLLYNLTTVCNFDELRPFTTAWLKNSLGWYGYSTVISRIPIRCSILNYAVTSRSQGRIRQDTVTLTVMDTSVSMSVASEYRDHCTSSRNSDLRLVHVHKICEDI